MFSFSTVQNDLLEKLGHLVLLVAVDTASVHLRSLPSFETRITLEYEASHRAGSFNWPKNTNFV